MDLALAGKNAFVTGASSGIGRRVAEVLSEEGVNIALFARRAELLEAVAADISRLATVDCVALPGDVSSAADVARAAVMAADSLGTVDIVVNCAGGSRPLQLESDERAWHEGLEAKFFSYRRVAHAFVDGMRSTGFGRIVNVTGTSDSDGLNAAHCGSAAVHAWAKGLSRTVGPDGITVNSVAPQRVLSEQLARKWPTEEERDAEARVNIPVARFGTVDDVARVVAFLVSPLSGFITGEIVHVDGGIRSYSF
jgi:3-oxoacyl-[acyl-carrier protein] reductase